MWHARTAPLVKAGKIAELAIMQEQHAERAQLYSQWEKLDFPMLQDPLNLLDVTVVPITLLVDSNGVIRYRNPNPALLEEFINTDYTNKKIPEAISIPGSKWKAIDHKIMQGDIPAGIQQYTKLLEKTPKAARLHFRLGAAYRLLYDLPAAQGGNKPEHFALAIQHWQQARKLNGRQYIWQRRLQQYGPLLDKPYPFYNWVAKAQQDIKARGEKPQPLRAALTTSELTGKSASLTPESDLLTQEPDPQQQITLSKDALVITPVILTATGRMKDRCRVHLMLKPSVKGNYEWNNEAGPAQLWLGEAPEGSGYPTGVNIPSNAKQASSSETRFAEFEWKLNPANKKNNIIGYVTYHVCEKKTGVCTILRQPVIVKLP